MTRVQHRRAELVCEALDCVPSAEDPASRLVQRLRSHLEGSRRRIRPDGTFDRRLDEAITLAEALLATLRRRPPHEEPRYALPPMPVVVAHRDLGLGQDASMVDVGLGGLRLWAPPTSRSSLRWSDPVDIAISPSEEAESAQIVGSVMHGVVVGVASDHAGLSVHVRFDRGEGDWISIDRWIRRLAVRSFEEA